MGPASDGPGRDGFPAGFPREEPESASALPASEYTFQTVRERP